MPGEVLSHIEEAPEAKAEGDKIERMTQEQVRFFLLELAERSTESADYRAMNLQLPLK